MVVSFPEPLILRTIKGENNSFLLDKFFACVVEYSDKTYEYYVSAGFKTDLASIPRIFWIIESPIDKSKEAAVIHDFLYLEKITTRKEADLIFYYGLKTLNVSHIKCILMYRAVRLLGWYRWRKKR